MIYTLGEGLSTMEPVFAVSFGNTALLASSTVSIIIGSALCWSKTGSVTVDTNAQKSANYFIVGFFYIWLTAVVIYIARWKYGTSKNARAGCGALFLLLGGLIFEGYMSF